MKKFITLSFILLVNMICCFSQNSRKNIIDSLLLELPEMKEDTNKVNLLNQLSFNYPYLNPDEGIKYGMQSLELSGLLKWKKGTAGALSAVGSNYANKADYANALNYEYKALKIYEELNDLAQQAIMLRNIGIVMHTSRNQSKALEYDFKSLDLCKKLNDKRGEAALYNNIANVYYTLGEKDKVIEYDLKALHLYEALNDDAGTAQLFGNIANYYAEEGDFSRAMVYYFNALRKENAMGNKNGVTRNMGNIGETYLDISKESLGKVKPDSLIPASQTANLRKAIAYLETAVENAKELKQTEYILAFGEVLSEAYQRSGNTKDAFHAFKYYISVRDSVYDVEKYNDALRKELNYEYGKRQDSIAHQKDIADLKLSEEKIIRKKEKIFYTCGIALILVFAGFMVNRWRITKLQKQIIEAEKIKSDQLLLNILPGEVAEELKEKGRADAKLFDEVTVMFTDFKNFTQISEKLTPSGLVAEIHECFKSFDEIISRYNIEKIKTIGDAYMCVGGLPVSNKTHAADVVSAALEIREFMVNRKKSQPLKTVGNEEFEVRIGIHTGPVVAGIVGVKKFAYDIWGDTVNIASRMESSGEAGKVNISGSTYELVKDRFTCIHRGKIQAKNKGEIDMYFVESAI